MPSPGVLHLSPTTCPVHQRQQLPSRSLRAPKVARAGPDAVATKTEDDGIRFKWDAANARWRRVEADRDEEGKYTIDKWEEGGVGTVQTKTGGAYLVWPIIHAKLQQRKLRSVTCGEAEELVQQGKAVLVDSRAPWEFDKQHVAGAISVPLFLDVAGKSFWDNLKKFVVRFGMNMRATERDPKFREKAVQTLDKNQTVIVYCGLGGTLHVGTKPYKPGGKSFKGDPERQFGRESRSLKTCYELQEAGFKNVLHLEGGISQWRHDGRAVEP